MSVSRISVIRTNSSPSNSSSDKYANAASATRCSEWSISPRGQMPRRALRSGRCGTPASYVRRRGRS